MEDRPLCPESHKLSDITLALEASADGILENEALEALWEAWYAFQRHHAERMEEYRKRASQAFRASEDAAADLTTAESLDHSLRETLSPH